MTRVQRLRMIARKATRNKCNDCGGTGWLKPGHRYGGCPCRLFWEIGYYRHSDVRWLVSMAARALTKKEVIR